MNSRIRTPFYIFFLNPDDVAARSLRSLCSNEWRTMQKKESLIWLQEIAVVNYSEVSFIFQPSPPLLKFCPPLRAVCKFHIPYFHILHEIGSASICGPENQHQLVNSVHEFPIPRGFCRSDIQLNTRENSAKNTTSQLNILVKFSRRVPERPRDGVLLKK